MDVRYLADSSAEAERWDAYVARRDGSTSDHWWGWRRVLRGAFGFKPHYLAALEGQQIVGILPVFQIPRGWKRWALSSIPFGNYGGVCADSQASAAALLSAAKELLGRCGAVYLELRHRRAMADETLQAHSLYSRFRMALRGDPQRHAEDLGSNNRRKISKAARSGARLVISRDLGALYPIHLHTVHRLGTPCFPRRYFELILEVFGDRAEIYLVELKGRFVAYDLALSFKGGLVCQFNGSLSSAFDCYPNNFLFWKAVEMGCQRGMRELDYCRSRRGSGTAQFKRLLRLEEEPLTYQYYLPRGQVMPRRTPSSARYQWLIRAWQRLPLAMTRWLGPSVVRYFA